MQHPPYDEYTALSDRMGHLLFLRVALATITLVWAAIRPESLGTTYTTLLSLCGSYLLVSTLAELGRRRAGRFGFAVMSGMLTIDGIYLAAAMYLTGATQSPILFLIYLHLVAVSLLASYRTGLKIALWHSLLLFVVLYAQVAALIPAVDVTPELGIGFDRMPVLHVTSFWLFALATSVFSAMNERELRQRRTDLQALVDVGNRLDDVTDPVLQARVVLDGLVTRFGFERGLVVGAAEGSLIVLASRGAGEWSGTAEADAVIRRSWESRDLLPVKRVSPEHNPMLAATMPGARNLLISPMMADGRPVGAIVVEHRSRSVFGVERRVASVLKQFSAAAALNLRNAVLLRHVQDLAERDSLTGAANRRMFQLTLERTMRNHDPAHDRTGVAVLFIDLDDFKVINDTLGHAAGDSLLIAVIERISDLVRVGDLVARLGGDEFAILTDDEPHLRRTRAMAERLVRELRVPYVIADHTITVSASIGIASAGEAGRDAQEIVRNADVAMYMAKANGKAGYAVFDPGMHASVRARHELGAELQLAVDLGQLRLVYQPIIAFDTGRIAGFEALVRWQHPERGVVVPGEFIEIAEENGAILPIGRWVLREACERAVAWQTAGIVSDSLFMCVNVSAREIQQPGFVGAVEEALAWAGLDGSRLILEITETALIKATATTVDTLEALRSLGVRVVIDDFGTGYFSLSHLRQFPVDALKIASEFVQVAKGDSRSAALAGAIVALGESLDIATVAEGIETKQHADRMRELGCTYGQGYFFAKPMSTSEIKAGVDGLATNHTWLPEERRAPTRRRRSLPAPTGQETAA
ncbi:MAG TPA: EAL domain-containing protein [Candidatus Binatia bacterium]|nr:EAL domain-containing protein [Candidatus Binatia bacterium]